MVAPNWPYVAARVIDYVVMHDGRLGKDDEPFEWHRIRAYNPGDPVAPTAVIGDPEAAPNAWLHVGADVVSPAEYYSPKPEAPAEPEPVPEPPVEAEPIPEPMPEPEPVPEPPVEAEPVPEPMAESE